MFFLKSSENRIAVQLIRKIIFLASLLCLIFALIVGYLSFAHQNRTFHRQADEIEKSYTEVLREALWIDDRDSVKTILMGIYRLPAIQYVGIRTGKKILFELGDKNKGKRLLRSFSLSHRYRGKDLRLGGLVIHGDEDFFRRELINNIFMVVLVQVLTIFVVCAIILWAGYQKIIARVLKITEYTSSMTLDTLKNQLALPPDKEGSNEIDDLADGINQMRKNLLRAYSREKEVENELKQAHDLLEVKVEERTRRLHETVAELEALFNNSQVGIMVLSGGRQCVRANRRMADILGFTDPSKMQGLPMRDIHLTEERFNEFGKKYYYQLRKNEVLQAEYQLRRKDGNPVWCTLSGKALDPGTPADLEKGVIWMVDDISDRKYAEAEREKLVNELKTALQEVKTLSGLLPICSHCKKIRDDQGYWNSLEEYIQAHSDAQLSHGICRDCAEKHYPEMKLYED